jgi:hypothetical protein
VLHKCDNKECVNPHHLEIGSHSKNITDGYTMGIIPSGGSHPRSTLTDDQVKSIRNDHRSNREIASILGVRILNVWRARVGINYKTVQ